MNSIAAVRPECVHSDAVAEFLEGGRKRRRRPALVVMDGQAVPIGIGRGSRSIQQDQDTEVASELAPLQIYVLGRGEAGSCGLSGKSFIPPLRATGQIFSSPWNS